MITLNATVENLSTRADRTVKIVIGTQENVKAAELFALQGKLAVIGIAENELTPDEITLLQESRLSINDVPNGKSRSQRLRNALYRYWEQHNTGFKTADDHYNDYMDKRTNHIISKLT